MKNLFLFFLLFTFSSTIFAQNRADYQFQFAFNNEFQEWRKATDGNLLGLIRPKEDFYHYDYSLGAGIVKFSPTGDSVLWATECQLIEEITFGLDFLELDSFILVCQLWSGCDFGGASFLQFYGLDKINGKILFSKEVNCEYHDSYGLQLKRSSTNAFRIQTMLYDFEFDGNQGIISTVAPNTPLMNSEANAAQDSLFYQQNKLLLRKADGTESEQVLVESVIDIEPLEPNKWAVLGETKIYIFSSALVLEKETALIGIADWSKINKVKDELWIFVENANPQAYCLDTTTYEIKRILDFEADYQVKNAFFQENDNMVWLSGDYLESRNKRFFMHKTDIQNPTFITEDVDIELVGISWSGTPSGYVTYCTFSPTIYANFDTIFAEVRNNGSQTVSNFVLNGLFDVACSACAYRSKSHSISIETSIAPGESKIVKFVDWHSFKVNSANDKICLWVAAPNNRLDKNIDNDYLCAPFTLMVPTKNLTNSTPFKIQNPSNGLLKIQPKTNTKTNATYSIFIFDVYGKRVFATDFSENAGLERFLDLPSGLYVYQILEDEVVLDVGKWVVEY